MSKTKRRKTKTQGFKVSTYDRQNELVSERWLGPEPGGLVVPGDGHIMLEVNAQQTLMIEACGDSPSGHVTLLGPYGS